MTAVDQLPERLVRGRPGGDPHEKAWRESLRELMDGEWRDIRGRTTWSPDAFTPDVYQKQISGKPRISGARSALVYFQVPDLEVRASECAGRKQAMVSGSLRQVTLPRTRTRCGSSLPRRTQGSG